VGAEARGHERGRSTTATRRSATARDDRIINRFAPCVDSTAGGGLLSVVIERRTDAMAGWPVDPVLPGRAEDVTDAVETTDGRRSLCNRQRTASITRYRPALISSRRRPGKASRSRPYIPRFAYKRRAVFICGRTDA